MLIFQANNKRLQPVSGLLSALLVKYPDMQYLAQRAFVTYLRSIHIQKDKEIFDVIKLPIDEFSASLGLPMTPKIRFLKQKIKSKTESVKSSLLETENSDDENVLEIPKEKLDIGDIDEEEVNKGFLLKKDTPNEEEGKTSEIEDVRYISFLELFMEVINFKDGRARILVDRNYTLLGCTSGSDSRYLVFLTLVIQINVVFYTAFYLFRGRT